MEEPLANARLKETNPAQDDWATKRHSAASLTRQALNWATESIGAMIDAHRQWDGSYTDPEHVAGLINLRKQMLAYRKKRFGWRYEPTAGAIKIDAMTRKPSSE